MIDPEVSRASAVTSATTFPRNGIGLDSWADLHLAHQKSTPNKRYDQTLSLAHGTCKCHREIGRKGVPRVLVPWDPDGDNIDLFSEGFLNERGCSIQRGEQHTLTTPKGRVTEIKMWGTLPYILKEELQRVIDDLPDEVTPGRSGAQLQSPTAARACRNRVPMSETRAHLKHLAEFMPKDQLNNVCSKYRNPPDAYYGGDLSLFIGPDHFKPSEDVASTSPENFGSGTVDPRRSAAG